MAELSVQELVDAALKADPDEHEHWDYVSELHRRGDQQVFNSAAELLKQSEPSKRCFAVNVLAKLDYEKPIENRQFRTATVDLLINQIVDEQNEDVIMAIAIAFGFLQDARAVPVLHSLRKHPDELVRRSVACGIDGFKGDLVDKTLIELSDDNSAFVRDWATFSLGSIVEQDSDEIRKALFERIDDSDQSVQTEAFIGLGLRGDERAIEPLLKAYDELSEEDSYSLNRGISDAVVALASHTGDERFRTYIDAWVKAWKSERPGEPLPDDLQAAFDRLSSR